MSSTVTTEVVREYVLAVREALDDLPPEELDELTGGLEADLEATISDDSTTTPDAAGLARRFGSPTEYAAELRSAAGLPARADVRGQHGSVARWQAAVGGASAAVSGQPWWPGLRRFLMELRPGWWVFRAGLGAWMLARLLGASPLGFLMLLAVGVVISAWLGRAATESGRGAARALSWLANAAAAFVIFVVVVGGYLVSTLAAPVIDYGGSSSAYTPPGLSFNGNAVRNVFVYDAQGNPLSNVQLFDDGGNPLNVDESAREPDFGVDRQIDQIPGISTDGQALWNVYPLRQRETFNGSVVAEPTTPLRTSPYLPTPPDALRVPTVIVPQGDGSTASTGASPGASPITSPAASATVTGTPSPSPSPSPAPVGSASATAAAPSASATG